ncbi:MULTISPECIES: hypothetical protein [Bacillales]|uniref:hypothetical protein n=1 Tax=Bacillales TaxID=1385 RepID=UPI0006A7E2E6|nr:MULTISPECIES: hypothetical protein [Bacillales]OBZ13028.1 hypothetical protein A7975_09015 [Bacillus sp. FJAT-26390]
MIRNVICMSVLLCTIAAALTSFDMAPERVNAAAAEQSKYDVKPLTAVAVMQLEVESAANFNLRI